jgi:hypothetical protein
LKVKDGKGDVVEDSPNLVYNFKILLGTFEVDNQQAIGDPGPVGDPAAAGVFLSPVLSSSHQVSVDTGGPFEESQPVL